ncbi:MAG: hypothetical protein GY856_48020 [bacterium]|nr:hypothetical protein [bacterium]
MSDPKRKLRKRTHLSALGVLCALIAQPSAAASVLLGRYEVAPGIVVEACGGFAGTCRSYSFTGTLRLLVDFDAGEAEILESDLQVEESDRQTFPFPNPTDLQPTDFVGTVAGSQLVRFRHPAGSSQEVDWRMSLSENALVLNGAYNEGCCDRFIYQFNNVTFNKLPAEPQAQLLLNGDRFAVEASWAASGGAGGGGVPVELTDDSGYFWFFDPGNVELVVKVLDACQEPYRRFWFFAAGLTNVEVTLKVTDLETGVEKTYFNPLGSEFPPILDTNAFATCDGG